MSIAEAWEKKPIERAKHHKSIKHPKDRPKLILSEFRWSGPNLSAKHLGLYIQKAEGPQKHLSLHTPAKTLLGRHRPLSIFKISPPIHTNSSQLRLLRYHCFVVALDPAIIVLRFIGLSAAAVAASCFF